MPLPVILNVVRCAVRGTSPSGQRWINVWHMHFASGTPPSAGDITALHAKFQKLYGGPIYAGGVFIAQLGVASCTADDITYTPLDGTTSSTVLALAAVAGTQAGDALPSQSAVGVTLRTGLRGRSKRGRIFLAFGSEAQTDVGGRLATGTAALVPVEFAAWITDLAGIGWTLVVASYKLSSAQSVTTVDVHRDYHVIRKRRA